MLGKEIERYPDAPPVLLSHVFALFPCYSSIVIQATPPFLVVHTNAAFARLTGIDSHHAVGQPIASLLSLPDVAQIQQEVQVNDESNPQPSDLGSNGRPFVADRTILDLERLVAASGHGRLHILSVVSRPHQMVGRSVTITKDVNPGGRQESTPGSSKHDAGTGTGRNEAASSVQGLLQKFCLVSIAPVVSASAYMPKTSSSLEKDADLHKAKRRKSHVADQEMASRPASPGHHKKHQPKLVVTHYTMQLEETNLKTGKDLSMESLSSNSTSVEARLMGLSKDQYKQQKLAVAAAQAVQEVTQADEENAGSESATTHDAVPTVG